MFNLLIALAMISVALAIISSIIITSYVSKRGVKINYFLWRLKIPKYVCDYKKFTVQETGRIGPWYYVLSLAMFFTILFALASLIIKH